MAKVFRKCKSATFQIGGDTYTIGKLVFSLIEPITQTALVLLISCSHLSSCWTTSWRQSVSRESTRPIDYRHGYRSSRPFAIPDCIGWLCLSLSIWHDGFLAVLVTVLGSDRLIRYYSRQWSDACRIQSETGRWDFNPVGKASKLHIVSASSFFLPFLFSAGIDFTFVYTSFLPWCSFLCDFFWLFFLWFISRSTLFTIRIRGIWNG